MSGEQIPRGWKANLHQWRVKRYMASRIGWTQPTVVIWRSRACRKCRGSATVRTQTGFETCGCARIRIRPQVIT